MQNLYIIICKICINYKTQFLGVIIKMKHLKTLSVMLTCFMAAASVQAMQEEADSSLRHVSASTSTSEQTVVDDQQAQLVGAVLLCGLKDYPREFMAVSSPQLAKLYEEDQLLTSKWHPLRQQEITKGREELASAINIVEEHMARTTILAGRSYLSDNNVGRLLEFLGAFIEETRCTNLRIIAPYVALLLGNAKAQEASDASAMGTARVEAKKIIEAGLKKDETNPLLLKTLFTHFLPVKDKFATDKFFDYCSKYLVASRVLAVKSSFNVRYISRIDGLLNIKDDSLVKIALTVAPNGYTQAAIDFAERSLRNKVKDILSKKSEKTTLEVAAETSGASAE